MRKTNKGKNKINYENTLKHKNNQNKPRKCQSTNMEGRAQKCTDHRVFVSSGGGGVAEQEFENRDEKTHFGVEDYHSLIEVFH